MNDKILQEIDEIVKNNDVVLFMKGTSDFPQCGFSGTVVSILKKMRVNFKDVNVLENDDIREGVKKYADWPTLPQLYVKGEFIGGCDITRELYENGELQEMFKSCK